MIKMSATDVNNNALPSYLLLTHEIINKMLSAKEMNVYIDILKILNFFAALSEYPLTFKRYLFINILYQIVDGRIEDLLQ